MADEVIVPLLPNPEEKENHNLSNANYDNELDNLLDNNIREEINNNNNNNIINNFQFNVYHKKCLIFFSYAMEVLIYLIFLLKYFDKMDFINNHTNILFIIFMLVLNFFIIVLIIHIPKFDDIREMNIVVGLITLIISSIFMYLFLYRLSVIMTLQFIKMVMIITISMYLYLSIINLYFSFFENVIEYIKIFVYLSSWIFILLLSFIFYLYDFVDKKIATLSFCIVCSLNIISTLHIEIIFCLFEVILRDYLIIHLILFIDSILLSLSFFLFTRIRKMNNVIVT